MATKSLIAVACALGAAFAQSSNAPVEDPRCSVSGTVTDKLGTPLRDIDVDIDPSSPTRIHAVTDAQGRYTVRGVAPGARHVFIQGRVANGVVGYESRRVTLVAGQDLRAIDFRLRLAGEILGKVVDENRAPVPGLTVFLVAREYTLGDLRYVFAGTTKADDEGRFRFQRVLPGRAFLVMARRNADQFNAISAAPADPKLRRPALVPTFHPNSGEIEGAQPVAIGPGERREGVDIRISKTRSRCIEGVLEGTNGPAPLDFHIGESRPTSGVFGDRGVFISPSTVRTGQDGRFRICDLHPGDYRLTVIEPSRDSRMKPASYASTSITVGDRDESRLRIPTSPGVPVSGEVVWDGAPPNQTAEQKLTIHLWPIGRSPLKDEIAGLKTQSTIPGEFSFDGLLMGEYEVEIRGAPSGAYIKDISYGGQGALLEPLRVGSAPRGAAIRVVLGRDGGTLDVTVADQDGNPVGDAQIAVLPASANSEAALAAAMTLGVTDQNGAWSSGKLAPGKYYALASATRFDRSPESIDKLWRARLRAQEANLAPGGALRVKVTPQSVE